MTRILVRALALTSLLVACAAPAAARKVALVVGIDAYTNLPRLDRAVSDARSVGGVLGKEIGFAVTTLENPTRREMARGLADLDASISPGDTVLFFFAGHGVALSSAENILLPADIASPQVGQEGLVRDDGFAVDAIIRRFQARGAAVTMMILDACRDNPFAATGTRSIGGTRGLARVDAPQGVFVLFSAGIGQKALDRLPGDDPAPTSLFTRHLLKALQTPGLTHVQIAKRVQQDVAAASRAVSHPQQPAYYDQIEGDVILRASEDGAAVAVMRDTPQPAVVPAPLPTPPQLVPFVGNWAGTAQAGAQAIDYAWRIEAGDRPDEVRGTITLSVGNGAQRATYTFEGKVNRFQLEFRGTAWRAGDRDTFCIAAGTMDLRMVRNFGQIVSATMTGAWGPNAVAGGCKPGTGGAIRLNKIVTNG